ncbi:hypothetical protein [Polyangium sp. 6x1]|uniref:hypothetical protein n=1 Tax=Polyangium sp. 6x1 TaxID=3042689 RepID=UPI00248267B0|nr:hypothetical protein [Polyangium sp. 6x1]MDI1451763.1 hypothetical protein [Polyangium sp. 6x1]
MEAAILTFLGALFALLVNKTAERVWGRRNDAAELARDCLTDLLGMLTSIEQTIESVSGTSTPTEYNKLLDSPSGWDLLPPSIKLDKLLGIFDQEDIHRLAILFHERYGHFVLRSKQHEDAYYWLLDHDDEEWTRPKARERLGRLKVTRSEMLVSAQDMMRFGYDLAVRLHDYSTTKFAVPIFARPSLPDFIRRNYGIDGDGLRLRKAYYGMLGVQRPFSDRYEYCRVVWCDEVARRFARGAYLELRVGGSESVLVEANETFALPVGSTVAVVGFQTSNASVQLSGMTVRVDQLKKYDYESRRLDLDPGDASRVMQAVGLVGASGGGLPQLAS